VAEEFSLAQLRVPEPQPPGFQDKVRFWIAIGLMCGVGVFGLLLIVCVTADWLTVEEAKDLSVMVIALFGIISPIIAFYFAARRDSGS
jgi:hypothetical protein